MMAKASVPKPRKATKKTAKKAAKKTAPAKKLRDQTPNLDDDYEAVKVRRQPKAAGAAAAAGDAALAGWRVALSLNTLLKQINAKAPNRSKVSDGAIGDAKHRSRRSDHNPWVRDGGMGVVTARDFTHDAKRGCDCAKLAASLRAARDKRVKYIIWNWQICWSVPYGGSPAWAWRRYRGRNGHTHHLHLSVRPLKALYDSDAPWSLAGM
jgi:hypothetical protein